MKELGTGQTARQQRRRQVVVMKTQLPAPLSNKVVGIRWWWFVFFNGPSIVPDPRFEVGNLMLHDELPVVFKTWCSTFLYRWPQEDNACVYYITVSCAFTLACSKFVLNTTYICTLFLRHKNVFTSFIDTFCGDHWNHFLKLSELLPGLSSARGASCGVSARSTIGLAKRLNPCKSRRPWCMARPAAASVGGCRSHHRLPEGNRKGML